VDASDFSVITKDGRSDVMASGSGAFSTWLANARGPVDTSSVALLADNPPETLRQAGEILLKLLANVQREPSNVKFRAIKLSNPKIESKLLTANGAFEILFSVGFEEVREASHCG